MQKLDKIPNPPASFYILNFGCKLNQSEGKSLGERMVRAGYLRCEKAAEADIVIVNGCTVTGRAQGKVRRTIGRYARGNAFVIVTGCYGDRHKPEHADLVFSCADDLKLEEMAFANEKKLTDEKILIPKNKLSHDVSVIESDTHHSGRTRAFLKIQDGCSNKCTYCIVRLARNRLWSLPAADVLKECQKLYTQGYREVVLLGANLSLIASSGELDNAVRMAYEAGFSRIRLGSVELSAVLQVARLMIEIPSLCRHIHIPLQSGSDRILASMKRQYNAEEFIRVLSEARQIVEGNNKNLSSENRLEYSVDVIGGFPGENDSDVKETVKVLKEVDIIKAHVFPFSPRPGTEAMNMPGYNQHLADKSAKCISEAATSFAVKRISTLKNSIQEVLVEEIEKDQLKVIGVSEVENKDGSDLSSDPRTSIMAKGYTRGYIRVKVDLGSKENLNFESDMNKRLKGKIIRVRITGSNEEELYGLPL